jgi:serine/threonine protein kinase
MTHSTTPAAPPPAPPPQAPALVPTEVLNTKVGEPLTIAKRIGRGRLGVVYAGVHPVLARRFAIKVLRSGLTRDENVQRRLRRMIREASTVEHPNVVSLVDFGQLQDGSTFLVMDFVRGIQLTKALTQEGRFTLARAVPLLIQLADALEAAHKLRVVHGDVKPNNILLVEQPNGGELLRLHDFAITMALAGKPTDEDPLGHLRIYASVEFLSPEQINNTRVDGRADIYAYGAVAYRVLTGEPPFVGEVEEMIAGHKNRDPVPPSRRIGAHDVPPELDAIVLRCLEKNPGDRFKTMDEVSRELRNLLPKGTVEEQEEITGRWKLPPELEEAEEPLPESPARQRQLFYDTMLELADQATKQNVVGEEMQIDLKALHDDRDEAATVAAQATLTENRFEDIRRELRERESTLRYAIIDLNLAKSDARERKVDDDAMRQIDLRIIELEQSLAELEQKRAERFAALNVELQKNREVLKTMEQRMAVHYRRLYAHLDEIRADLTTDEARKLYRLLERCRAALAKAA